MDSHEDRTEARVRAALAAELRRAEADLELSPLQVDLRPGDETSPADHIPRRRHRALAAGLLTAATAVIVVVAVGAGLLVGGVRNAVPAASPSNVPTIGVASPSAATPSATSSIPRYGDGIPRMFEGQPVVRWDEALARRQTATDDTPFLVGVWLDVPTGWFSCTAGQEPDPSALNSWISRGGCQFNYISADPGGQPMTLNGVATFRFSVENPATGPAIMRAHVHDSRASQCGSEQTLCDDMIVVDDILWTGDAATAPSPLSVADVIAAAGSIEPGTSLALPTMTSPTYDGGGGHLTDSIVLAPVDAAELPADMQIAGAYLMPSVEAMRRALPNVQPGAAGALLQSAYLSSANGWGPGYAYSVEYRWLVVDNVALSVRVASPPTDADEAWFASIVATLDTSR